MKTPGGAPHGGFRLGPVDLDCKGGSTIAVLGPNGSGKSTLFNLVAGQTIPDSGTITLAGSPAHTVRARIGYLPQQGMLPTWATPRELCDYSARLIGATGPQGNGLAENTLHYWDCLDFQHNLVGNLSTGMRKRVGLALATLHNPDLLILDEPFEALDLGHIAALRQEIKRRTGRGLITIFATHIASCAAALANGVYFMGNGRATRLDWPAEEQSRIAMLEEKFLAAAPPPPGLLHPYGAKALQ